MLISRNELRYEFQGATFDLSQTRDRDLLGWIFNQFLYGEVTGIQCGHWLYRAPHLNAAAFLAKQAGEEIGHVRRVLRILSLLDQDPRPAHPAIRFLSTGMMGGSWGEHVAMEMALGEGLVLSVFYAMAETIPDPEIHKILESAAVEEERHVEFGERETIAWLKDRPQDRKLLLGLALLQTWALHRLKRFVIRGLLKGDLTSHPVLGQIEKFYEHAIRKFELRIERLGLSSRPLREMGRLERLGLIAMIPARKMLSRWGVSRALLTKTYLSDPVLLAESRRRTP